VFVVDSEVDRQWTAIRRTAGSLLQRLMGTVCDDRFDDDDAKVACKSFGTGLVY